MEKIRVKLNTSDKIKRFLKTTRSFESDIDVMTDRAVIDGKSVMGVYALNLSDNTYVKIISDDVDECTRFINAMEEFK